LLVNSESALVQIISLTVSFRISIPAFKMNIEITTQINHSIHTPKKMLIKAAISVDNEIRLSFNASTPLAIKLHEFSFFH
jgi:hypothetical protein